MARDLPAAAPRLGWPLTYVQVPGAEHIVGWNVTPAATSAGWRSSSPPTSPPLILGPGAPS